MSRRRQSKMFTITQEDLVERNKSIDATLSNDTNSNSNDCNPVYNKENK